jgi:hypothetical protein
MSLSTVVGFAAGLSFFTGIVASALWFRSAATSLTAKTLSTWLGTPDGHANLADWLARGSALNKWAAIWTAISVALAGLSAVLDHI